jgi:ribonuclease HI
MAQGPVREESSARMKITVHFDGGSRGNPGPAAAAAVAYDANGEELTDRVALVGEVTNNVAEYRALLLAVSLATDLEADEVEFVGDSQLIVRQITGEYKVKKADLKPLHAEAKAALTALPKWSITDVRRESNERADELLNEALDSV